MKKLFPPSVLVPLLSVLFIPLSASAITPPIAAYPLNESSGTTTLDASGHSLTGTVTNGPLWTIGQFGNDLSFDGANDFVNLGSPAALDNVNTFSYCAWVNPKNMGGQSDGRLIHKGSNTARKQFHIDSSVTNSLALYVDRAGGAAQAISVAGTLSLNQWQYVCATYSEADGPRVYKNGVEVSYTTRVKGTGASTDESAGNFYIGNRSTADKGWNGAIDEVVIYSSIITPSDMLSNMTHGIDTVPPSVPTNLTADTVSSGHINLLWTASTDAGGVMGYYVFRNGLGVGSTMMSMYSDTGLQPLMTYTYTVAAMDVGGNFSASSSSATATTSAAPQLVITTPEAGATSIGSVLDVTYTTSGNLADVDHVHFQLDNNPVVMDLSFDGVYQLTNITAGPHTLKGFLVMQNHSKINGTDASPTSFTILANPTDTQAPQITLASPTNNQTVSATTTVAATASDNTSVAGVQFKLDGNNLGAEDVSAPYSILWNTVVTTNGPHTLHAVARDDAGNQTISSTTTINILNINPNDPSQVGQWSSVLNWPLVAVHMNLLPTGKILMFDRMDMGGLPSQIWDPSTNTFTPVPNDTTDLFCTGHTLLSNGSVLVEGEHVADGVGTRESNIFNPFTQTWTALPLMNYARWYPTATALPDGRVLATSGSNTSATSISTIPEVYNPKNNTWTAMPAANQYIPLYPFMFVLSDGTLLQAGAEAEASATRRLNVATQTWSTVDPREIDGGSAVMYAKDKIMKSGSWLDEASIHPAVATTYVIDMSLANPVWRQTASSSFPRVDHNLTLLPDGTTLATGGSRITSKGDTTQAVLEAESWNSLTEKWKTLAPMQTARLYHSSAILLPDGRVLAAGGGRSTSLPTPANEASAEIFSPPYLFKGARPIITSAPTVADYGSQFFVGTTAQNIQSVSLVALGSVTHSFNANQRFINLAFTGAGGGLNVTAPLNANIAPPGYYMLFIVDANGVPSIASFVQLPLVGTDTEAPSAPTNLVGTSTLATVTLNWTASTDNVAVAAYYVYRSTTPNFTPTLQNKIAETTSPQYIDQGLQAAMYYYSVIAVDAEDNASSQSNEATVTVINDPSGSTPIATYSFNQGSGATATDGISGNTGTLQNGTLWAAAGKFGSALIFDGANDAVSLGSPAALDNVNTLTYCAWINPRSMGGQSDGRLMHKGTNSTRKQFHFDSSTANSLSLHIDRSGGTAQAISTPNTLTLNQWQYVCATYNETDGPRLYKNGVEVSYSSRLVSSGATVDESASNFYIGNRSTVDKAWDGSIDEVRIYNSVITPAKMQTDMITPL